MTCYVSSGTLNFAHSPNSSRLLGDAGKTGPENDLVYMASGMLNSTHWLTAVSRLGD